MCVRKPARAAMRGQRHGERGQKSEASSDRMATLARLSSYEREGALAELRAGQKRGHWVWWLFPTLAARGGDMNSARMAPGPSGADLADADEAIAYLQNTQLRSGLLAALNAVDCAMSAAGPKAPWQVLDRGFGRAADGEWVGGPVDSYKVWCSATLFAAVAHKLTPPDAEVRAAAVGVLRHFKGDVVYTSGGRGTAGGPTSTRYVLGPAPDEGTLALVGGVQWSDIIAATPTQPPACGAGAPPPPPPPAIEPSPAPEPERDAPTPQAREGDLPPRLAPPVPPPLAPPPLAPPRASSAAAGGALLAVVLCAVMLCAVCRRRARRRSRLLSSSRSDGVEVADI